MSNVLSRMLGVAAAVLAVVVTLSAAHGSARPAMAGGDPLAVGQRLIDAVNANDSAAAAATFADDGWFQVVDGGSFGAFGRAAIDSAFQDISQEDNVITLVSSNVSGNTVTGVLHITDNDARAAEIERYVQPFTLVVENAEIASLDLRYDTTDAQTQTYLAYVAKQSGDNGPEPPDLLALSMTGRQAGQVHAGTFATGVIIVFFEIAAGPEGVLQPAGIYHGSCSSLGSRSSPLALVEGGSSGSLVGADLQTLVNGSYTVAVHASQTDDTVVSCANIVRAPAPTATAPAPTAPAPTATPLPSLGNTGTGGGSDGNVALRWWLLGIAALGATVAGSVAMRSRRA